MWNARYEIYLRRCRSRAHFQVKYINLNARYKNALSSVGLHVKNRAITEIRNVQFKIKWPLRLISTLQVQCMCALHCCACGVMLCMRINMLCVCCVCAWSTKYVCFVMLCVCINVLCMCLGDADRLCYECVQCIFITSQ